MTNYQNIINAYPLQ